MRHIRAAVLALACAAACQGRKPQGEFRFAARVPQEEPSFANALYQATGVTMTPGNLIEPVDNGAVFDAIDAAVRSARKSIHVVTFIWADGHASDRLIAAISERTREGVACRVLVDAVGSPSFDRVGSALERAGCEWHSFRPLGGQDDMARNHRKIVIVDGRVGFTGGFGIDDRWEGDGRSSQPEQWRDSNVRVRGPAVLAMQQAFAENWLEETGRLLPDDAFPEPQRPGPALAAFVTSTEHSVATRNDKLIQLLISTARKRVWIANAYFVPSAPIAELLARKGREGVDVRILAPGDTTDTKPYLPLQRARMDNLAQYGVRVFEYEAAMMHGKTMVVDDRFVLVGSCNLDPLSLNHMDEGGIVADDPELAREEERRFTQDLAYARERDSSRRTAAR